MSTFLEGVHQVAMFSSDLDRSIAFYRDTLGATFLAKFDPPGLVFFRVGSTRLLLEKRAPRATVYFWVDDIQRSAERLRAAGVKLETPPQVIHRDDQGLFGAPGGEEWMAFFRDPDDNVLALASRRPAGGAT
jgi:methylmalonyl-CoA/ethylmalonyl-CoA epimerase